MIHDETGKKLKALTVFSMAIEYLKDDVLQEASKSVVSSIGSDDVRWVLTVPAIWDDSAKQFMREAAQNVNVLVSFPKKMGFCVLNSVSFFNIEI